MYKDKRGLDFSMESIDFQNDSFFKELTILFAEVGTELKGKSKDEMIVMSSTYSERFTDVVRKYTKSSIVATIDNNMLTRFIGPYSMSPQLSKNHVLVDQLRREYLSNKDFKANINKSISSLVGSIDLRNGQVSGVFTKMPAEVHIPIGMLTSWGMTAEESAAIALHEIGHIMTFFEFIARTASTNQVLAYVAKNYNDSTYIEREKILYDVKEILRLKSLNPSELAKMDKLENVNIVIISDCVAQTRSELGSNIYDSNAWEQLADEYAARMGAGRALVTSLEKLMKGDFLIRGRAAYYMLEAYKILLLIVGGILSVTPGVNFVGIVTLLWYFSHVSVDSNKRTGEYDTPRDRLQRIRNQLVEAVKDKTIPVETVKQYVEDIEVIDGVMKNIPGNRQLYDVVREYVNPYARKYRNQMLLQRELEDLANNDLFVAAAELKHQL